MKFLSVFTVDPTTMSGPPSDAMMSEMGQFVRELMQAGKMVDTGGRAPTGTAVRVQRSGSDVTVIDGPFTETKEIVGGFAVFNVDSKAEVVELTKRFLSIVGGGTCQLFEISETPGS